VAFRRSASREMCVKQTFGSKPGLIYEPLSEVKETLPAAAGGSRFQQHGAIPNR
jgi:hypothetical protein